MSIKRYRDDDPRTADEVADAIKKEIQSLNSDAPVVPGTQNYAYVQSLAKTLSDQQEQALADLYDAAYIIDATGIELTKRADEIGVTRQSATKATGVIEFTRDSPATQDRTIQSGTRVATGGDDSITFQTTKTAKINGPSTKTDSSTYSTQNTSFTTKNTFTVNTDYLDSLDVSGDLKTDNNSYTAYLKIVDVTNSNNIDSFSTTSTSYVSKGATTYDTSNLSGDIDIEYQLQISNSSGTAEATNLKTSIAGNKGTQTNIEASVTGPSGNVGKGTISVMIDQPAGVDDVNNIQPTGDNGYKLIDGSTSQTIGQEEENDTSLRQRALDSAAIGGSGTAEASELALENIDEVVSADVFTNRTSSTTNNVDPWHTEVRVYGGDIDNIAERLYEVFPLPTIKTLQGGANGTKQTTTLTISDLYGDLVIEITRPTEITLEIDIDVVHEATYPGTDFVKDAIVEYIGGTTTDNRSVAGLGQGENVLVNEVENTTEDITGVDYADVTLVDDSGNGADDTTTDADGVPVYDLGDSEVAIVDEADITVSETQR